MLPFVGIILSVILVVVDGVENDDVTIIGNLWLWFLKSEPLSYYSGNMLKGYAQSKKIRSNIHERKSLIVIFIYASLLGIAFSNFL